MNPMELRTIIFNIYKEHSIEHNGKWISITANQAKLIPNFLQQGYELLTREEYAIEKENIKNVVHISVVDLVLIKRKDENKI